LRAFEDLAKALQNQGATCSSAARAPAGESDARADFHRHIGDANICAHVADALQQARTFTTTAGRADPTGGVTVNR
jgi:hypothetical protein